MKREERIEALVLLGQYISDYGEHLQAYVGRTEYNNKWFTKENQKQSLLAIASQFLDKDKLEKWVSPYAIPEENEAKTVGLVLAGNIPLVGFHDVLTVFVSGHKSLIKLSDKDRFLLPHLLDKLKEFAPASEAYFELTERMGSLDAVIATGSNNSARYFEAYFGKYPNIIRKNRHAVAVLDGKESEEELRSLGHDIFSYFGLGCRNVSKLYLPKGYDFNLLMETLHEFNYLIHNSKYKNNFDYNIALFQLNRIPLVNNGSIILVENEAMTSRIATMHYEFYEDVNEVEKALLTRTGELQLVATNFDFTGLNVKKFGEAQQPSLNDYADGVDSLEFLVKL
jgi:hypothetical protein